MLGIRQYKGIAIDLYQGDITTFVCDAMVNAANSELAGGGGVDGAIHRAGGPSIMTECRQKYPQGCRTGTAVVTSAGHLPAKWVIHTVGPIWHGGNAQEAQQLASAYHACLTLADDLKIRHIAFPSISTGTYRYPLDAAAAIALTEIKRYITTQQPTFSRISFVLFNQDHYSAYQKALFTTFEEND